MERIATPAFAEMNAAQREVYTQIATGPRGVVQGPLMVWLHNPEMARHAQSLGAYCRYGTSLPPRLSELAILITGAHWRAEFEWAIHAPIGIAAGLASELVESLRNQKRPVNLKDDEWAVYEFSVELLQGHRVSDETFAFARKELGNDGVVDLIAVLGYYGLISMTLNAFEVSLPAGSEKAFSES